ncbi:MAG: NAD(P)-dependent oxidoreductase [Bacteroidales bacterium]|nr:NAD(P)-dependent oxidoreductase [Bacteroidales bacterium]
MAKRIKVGILKETKSPPDKRVPATPLQVVKLIDKFPNVDVCIQPSDIRCYSDEEYKYLDLNLQKNLSDCEILLGVKEVDVKTLIPNKTYVFFAHVAKKQPYNRRLLQEIIEKNIRLIDYEYLTDCNEQRIVAFGRWAGIVGAYNGLRARGIRTDKFDLKPAHQCKDMDEMFAGLKNVRLKKKKILVTGGGRVAMGAMETLDQLNIKKVSVNDFLNREFDEPVLCRIDPEHYVRHKGGMEFNLQHFFKHPDEYESTFKAFTKVTDVFVACHYWDPRSPKFISKEDCLDSDFKITVIADVSCDVNGPIASTVKASTIASPFYGYNPQTGKAEPPFVNKRNITVMAVDNLPGELPRNASSDFGMKLINDVYPSLFGCDDIGMIERATITKEGKLTEKYAYLQDYLEGKE